MAAGIDAVAHFANGLGKAPASTVVAVSHRILGTAQNKIHLWRFDPGSGKLDRQAVALPEGAWADAAWSWGRDPASGLLYPPDPAPADAGARPEPELAEPMIVRALATEARVTAVGEPAALPLRALGGVGALLRW